MASISIDAPRSGNPPAVKATPRLGHRGVNASGMATIVMMTPMTMLSIFDVARRHMKRGASRAPTPRLENQTGDARAAPRAKDQRRWPYRLPIDPRSSTVSR